jgi:hypothetical protein
MKKIYLKFSLLVTISIITLSFTSLVLVKKEYCMRIQCKKDTWYEKSPAVVTSGDAKNIMEEKYPGCKVQLANPGSCD